MSLGIGLRVSDQKKKKSRFHKGQLCWNVHKKSGRRVPWHCLWTGMELCLPRDSDVAVVVSSGEYVLLRTWWPYPQKTASNACVYLPSSPFQTIISLIKLFKTICWAQLARNGNQISFSRTKASTSNSSCFQSPSSLSLITLSGLPLRFETLGLEFPRQLAPCLRNDSNSGLGGRCPHGIRHSWSQDGTNMG